MTYRGPMTLVLVGSCEPARPTIGTVATARAIECQTGRLVTFEVAAAEAWEITSTRATGAGAWYEVSTRGLVAVEAVS